jgi:tetratricopeptide (TPR) repeat protein
MVLAKAVPEDGVSVNLKKGEYQEALRQVSAKLENPQENAALRLYECGLAQFQLGVAKHDEGMVKDAGLSFMRVVIYFGRAGGASPYYGPALIGAGQVFQQLNRPDLAVALYRQARDVVSSDADAPLAALRDELLQGLAPEKKPAP